MGILDTIGKQASEKSTSLFGKARNLTDVTKLSAQISDLERKLKMYYQLLGEAYVQIHESDYDPAFKDLMKEIEAARQAIQNYEQQVKDIKGVVICPKCGTEVPKSASFCPGCGSAVQAPAPKVPENMVQCASCGTLVQKDMAFCTGCGAPLAAKKPEIPAAVQPAVCHSCGNTLKPDALFCNKCGHPAAIVN